jgi:hypothetical protein
MYSEKEMQKINSKLESIKCPICKCTVFSVNNKPSQVISYHEDVTGNINPSLHSSINCIRVNCVSCGYVMQFKETIFLNR